MTGNRIIFDNIKETETPLVTKYYLTSFVGSESNVITEMGTASIFSYACIRTDHLK